MNIEIKSLKIAKFASEETLCFEASIYLDGKKIGVVSNEGRGGSNRYHFTSREVEETFRRLCQEREVPCYCTRYKIEGCKTCGGAGVKKADMDDVIDDLVSREEEQKEDKKVVLRFKKKGLPLVVKVKEGGEVFYYANVSSEEAALVAHCEKKHQGAAVTVISR